MINEQSNIGQSWTATATIVYTSLTTSIAVTSAFFEHREFASNKEGCSPHCLIQIDPHYPENQIPGSDFGKKHREFASNTMDRLPYCLIWIAPHYPETLTPGPDFGNPRFISFFRARGMILTHTHTHTHETSYETESLSHT